MPPAPSAAPQPGGEPQSGPNKAVAALIDLQALRNGQSRVVLQPGSGIAKLPAAQEEELQGIVKMLSTAPPPLVQFYLKQTQAIRSDAEVDRLIVGMNEYAQQQSQQQLALENAKGQNAQSLAQQKAQNDQQAAAYEAQVEQTAAAIDLHKETALQQLRDQSAVMLQNLKDENAMALQRIKASAVNVTLAATAGPTGVGGVEELAGLPETDSPADMKPILSPPKPAPGTVKKTNDKK
jgi:hypothetical protein